MLSLGRILYVYVILVLVGGISIADIKICGIGGGYRMMIFEAMGE